MIYLQFNTAPSLSITPKVPTVESVKNNTIFFCFTQKGLKYNKHSVIYICHYTLALIFSTPYLPSMMLFYHQCVFVFQVLTSADCSGLKDYKCI